MKEKVSKQKEFKLKQKRKVLFLNFEIKLTIFKQINYSHARFIHSLIYNKENII